jgi:hypothetical protein
VKELNLSAGPKLVSRTWQEDRNTGEYGWAETDVTNSAHERLFESVTLADDVTLADIFGLMDASPVLKAVYLRDFSEPLCVEAAKGPLAFADEKPADALDYLEIYQHWALDTSTSTYEAVHQLSFHAIGVVQLDDYPEMGVSKGERLSWGVSASSPRHLLHLPLRVNPEVRVSEDDVDAKAYGRELTTVRNPFVTLGQILHAILWELSYFGVSTAEGAGEVLPEEDSAAENVEVATQCDLVMEEGDIMEGLMGDSDRAGAEKLFDTIGTYRPHDIYRALRTLEDDENAATGLLAALGESVVLKSEYQTLLARALRKEFRLARTGEDGGA